MNVYDSGRMADVLAPLGYGPATAAEGADMVILNTCHIREKAAEKVFSELGRLRTLQRQKAANGGRMIIAVAGCVAQAEGELIRTRAPHVDIVVGPLAYHRLPELVARATRAGGGVVDTDFPVESKFDHLPEATRPPGVSAFLSVQEGCDRFCTFCVVPYTRGAEYSRPVAAILAEAISLIRSGAREITLLGQNVNAYHGTGPDGASWSLARLIRALAEIEDCRRSRYTTSPPRDLGEALIAAHVEVPKLMPFLHLPVQSGSASVLAAMNRRHGPEEYRRLVEKLRHARPDIALSSDFIVGFPGESEADFESTLALVEAVGFAQAYSFKYSPRQGTPAAAMSGQVPEPVKAERLERLQDLIGRQQEAFNRTAVGRILPTLFEKVGRHAGQVVGRSPYLQPVHVEGPTALIGSVAAVEIERLDAHSLAGSIVDAGILPRRAEPAKTRVAP